VLQASQVACAACLWVSTACCAIPSAAWRGTVLSCIAAHMQSAELD
jgi:hypothetical protein